MTHAPYKPQKATLEKPETRNVLLFPALLESDPYRRDEFLVVEWFHEKGERADGLGGGVCGHSG